MRFFFLFLYRGASDVAAISVIFFFWRCLEIRNYWYWIAFARKNKSHPTWRAPPSMADMKLATAIPRSSWPWTEMVTPSMPLAGARKHPRCRGWHANVNGVAMQFERVPFYWGLFRTHFRRFPDYCTGCGFNNNKRRWHNTVTKVPNEQLNETESTLPGHHIRTTKTRHHIILQTDRWRPHQIPHQPSRHPQAKIVSISSPQKIITTIHATNTSSRNN